MKRVLILNRRCIKHPERGGAEVYTFECAKALIEHGYNVVWFSSRSSGLADKEELEGITFVRKGNELTTHFHGFLYALKEKDCFIIDAFNGIGFFTFFMKNSIILIHQTYNEFWTSELGLLGYPFKYLEKILLHLYSGRPAITVSDSTCRDLKEIGFKNIEIIHNGIDIKPLDHIPEKESALTLIYLGRLKKTKNPEDAIRAFLRIRNTIKDAKLWIAGDGPLYGYLTKKYGQYSDIHFWGFVEDRVKHDLLRRAHFLLVPSIREGWGLVVIEANAAGTPAIGYRVKGLIDSIRDGRTGILVDDPVSMATQAIVYWQDKKTYDSLCIQALEWAKEFSWTKTRKQFILRLERGLS
ncbi:MAG: glycosyltransferase family 4 protein [Dissulfurispiraceae bacterium]